MNAVADAPDAAEHEALLQFLYMAPVGLVQAGSDGAILMLNPLSAQLLMPLSADGNLLNLFEALAPVAPDLRQRCAGYAAPSGNVCEGMRLYLNGARGGPQVLSLTLLKLDAARLMAVLSDITEQDKRERQLRNTDAWLNAIMTNIADYALVSLDQDGRVAAWNDSIGRVTGFDEAGVRGQPFGLFYPADDASAAQQAHRLQQANLNGWHLDEGLRRRADGSQFWGSAMLSPLPGRKRDDGTLAPAAPGEPAYCLILRDITDKRALSENLRSATYGDHLTGLANRRAFFEAGELEMLRRAKMPQAPVLILIDADHFKAINDSHGHPAGDAVLRHLGATLKSMFRQVDTVARIGGEEFAAILPSASLADAAIVAERLRERVQASPAMFGGAAIAYTISIGVAAMDDPACTLAGFLQRADDALYAAKRGGRNRVVCWPAEVEAQA